MEHLDWINDELTILAEAFGEQLTAERQEIYCAGLADIRRDHLQTSFRRARYELKWFPKLAELRELAGALPEARSDGRPGPEEAWAKMPKGERMEDDSIVWCEEERIAYGACRTLLLDGDLIGARMAFKERYERELLEARALGKPVCWTMSAGYDMGHRLSTLATAVQDNRLSLNSALHFVPEERRTEFAHMLPAHRSGGLLSGQVERSLDLPGLPGILAKMRMEGLVPEEVRPESCASRSPASELTSEDYRKRREDLRAQIELIRRSRNGSTGSPG